MTEATDASETTILLVRHGQSEWNLQRRWQGQADPPLSEFGEQQAAIAATRIGQVDAIVASPLKRAVETATIIGEQIGVGPVEVVDALIERDIGIWSGLTRVEINQGWPGWVDSGRRLDDWEPDSEVEIRAVGAIEQIHRHYGRATVLAVAHHGVIAAVERHLGVASDGMSNLYARIVHVNDHGLRAGETMDLIPDQLRTGGGYHRPVVEP